MQSMDNPFRIRFSRGDMILHISSSSLSSVTNLQSKAEINLLTLSLLCMTLLATSL